MLANVVGSVLYVVVSVLDGRPVEGRALAYEVVGSELANVVGRTLENVAGSVPNVAAGERVPVDRPVIVALVGDSAAVVGLVAYGVVTSVGMGVVSKVLLSDVGRFRPGVMMLGVAVLYSAGVVSGDTRVVDGMYVVAARGKAATRDCMLARVAACICALAVALVAALAKARACLASAAA